MKIIPIPLFHLEQNYAYLVITESKDHCFLVDPADSKVVLKFLESYTDIKISHILFTHKHWDHVGDAKELLPIFEKQYGARPDVVLGAADSKDVSEANITIGENKAFEVNEIRITCIPVPCHTRGSLLYYLEDKDNSSKHNDLTLVQNDGVTTYRGVFTGDTHFIGGCGKFFEGNAEEMYKNLTTLSELPKDTFIFPGHEYTVSNLKWAMGIEWENEAYGEKLKWAEEKRAKDEYTVPSTVAEEFEINIFWRTRIDRVQERAGSKDPAQVLGSLREMKDKKVSLVGK